MPLWSGKDAPASNTLRATNNSARIGVKVLNLSGRQYIVAVRKNAVTTTQPQGYVVKTGGPVAFKSLYPCSQLGNEKWGSTRKEDVKKDSIDS